MKRTLFIFVAIIAILLTSCDSRRRHRGNLLTPASSGTPYEVMVVVQDDSVWEGLAGKALQQILDRPLQVMPQYEPQFHKSHVTEAHYDRITNLFRNIVRINIGKDHPIAKLTVERDVHSVPQLIVNIVGPTQFDVSIYITQHTSMIEDLLSNEEINRAANDLVEVHNPKVAKRVKEMFDCDLFVPADLRHMKEGKDFLWISNNGLASIQNICIYSYPYISQKMLQKKAYIALRDTIMKKNIPGGQPGQYMQTNAEYVKTQNISVAGKFAMEARGLWEMKNDAMGGPFISHSVVDTKHNRVIVVEGFVYAPGKMKRTMIRRLEAALYTLKVAEKDEQTEKNDKTK